MPLLLSDIKQDLKQYPRNPNQYPQLRIRKIESILYAGVGSVMYKAVCEGETDNYVAFVQFFGVDVSNEKDDRHPNSMVYETADGKSLKFFETPSVKNHPVKLKCSCSDFRFRWEKPLYDSNGLIGNWRRYERKTTTAPSVNPNENLGYCKHLQSFVNALKESERIKA